MTPNEMMRPDASRLRALADTLDGFGDSHLAAAARLAADEMDATARRGQPSPDAADRPLVPTARLD